MFCEIEGDAGPGPQSYESTQTLYYIQLANVFLRGFSFDAETQEVEYHDRCAR